MRVTFTARELDVMSLLWESGSGTVSEVRDRLSDDLAYTTVLTILRTLESKGHVRHESEGRAHRYYPTVERSDAGESALRHLTAKVFGGSAETLLAHLVSDKGLKPRELARMRKLLEGEIDRRRESP